MTIVSSVIPSPVNGVSQQPSTLRLSTQLSEQINCFSSEVDGLRRRAPTDHVAILSAVAGGYGDAYFHWINRDAAERYLVVILNGSLKVYGLDGIERTVTYPNGGTYLSLTAGSKAKDVFKAVTVSDSTFIVNTQMVVAKDTNKSPTRNKEAMVVVLSGQPRKHYKVTVKYDATSFSADYETPQLDGPGDEQFLDTNDIANEVYALLLAAKPSDFDVTLAGNKIVITRDAPGDFAIATEDGFNGNSMKAYKDSVQTFSDLPNRAPDGFFMKVVGNDDSAFVDYYVKFEPSSGAGAGGGVLPYGVWKETVAQDVDIRIKRSTMPHQLVRMADGSFELQEAVWADRMVGDDDSNDFPTFVGAAISDIFFHRDRLGLLSKSNTILSQARELFNFFDTTVTQILDDAPIDVPASTNKVADLQYAVPFNGDLLLFSSPAIQFRLKSDSLLTRKTISMLPISEYEADAMVRPVVAGKYLYFPASKGDSTLVQEFYIDTSTETADAQPANGHCPSYVPSGSRRLAISSTENLLLLQADETLNSLFAYRYYFSGNDKVLSSWSRWDFGDDVRVLSMEFIGSTLWLAMLRGNIMFLEKMVLSPQNVDPDGYYVTQLDRRITEQSVSRTLLHAEPGTGLPERTRFTLPFLASTGTMVTTRADGINADYPVGDAPEVISVTGNTVTVAGDYTTGKLWIGRKYASEAVLSDIYMRRSLPTGGQAPILGGRLQLQHINVGYSNAGYFEVWVTPRGRSKRTHRFAPASSVLGRAAVSASGFFRLSAKARNTMVEIRLYNDSHLPSTFQSIEWEGFYTNLTRPL